VSARAARLEAALFDMDGVVTDTAQAHAGAWQRLFDEYLKERAQRLGEVFRPFDPDKDYRRYVDGKPRMDGVGSFLDSRGIELPYGKRDDAPQRETVCGLGNRKDRYFNEWLEANRVRAYPGTLALAEALRRAGVRVAVFSASRNAEAVLRNAGVLELFDARVDGVEAARLGLPGKPDPAMLLEAARRLSAAPAASAVFEDAIAGVEAGARGGFGLVVGIARGDYGDELKAAGAHLVVRDLAELGFEPESGRLTLRPR
jgi:alpha,alpha-trehalase